MPGEGYKESERRRIILVAKHELKKDRQENSHMLDLVSL